MLIMKNFRRINFTSETVIATVLILLAVSFIVGVFVGRHVNPLQTFNPIPINNNSTTSGQEFLDLNKINVVLSTLQSFYVDPEKIDAQKMSEGALKGMVDALDDPATYYLNAEETKEFKQEMAKSTFEGIGAQLGYKDGQIIIVAPLEGSPAQKAGIRSGDVIIGVDDTVITKDMSIEKVVSIIRGEAGTTVDLHVIHQGEVTPTTITITRGKIIIPSIKLEISKKDPSIAILHVYKFTDSSLSDWEADWDNAIVKFKASGATKLILDLRNNPGGFMDAAVYAGGEFLPKGSVVVKQTDKYHNIQESKVTRKGKLLDVPMVVLVNQGSASASEILTGALQYYKRATVVGTKTFGKGTAQEIKEFTDGSSLHVTVYKWLLPDGRHITHKKSITPDIEVKYTNDEFKKGVDPQLEEAVKVLTTK